MRVIQNLEQYYNVLGLEPGASLDEINQAYKDLAFIWHPDRLPQDNQRLIEKSAAKLKEINQARDFLRSLNHSKTVSHASAQPKSQSYRRAQQTTPQQREPFYSERRATYSYSSYYQQTGSSYSNGRYASSNGRNSSRNSTSNGSSSSNGKSSHYRPYYRPYYKDLTGADMSQANLKEKDLSGRNLKQANLSYADLTDSFLHKIILEDANLKGANLFRANLLGANLRNANLQETNLIGADFSGADLSGANLTGAKIGFGNKIMVKLTGAKLTGTILPNGTVNSVN